MKQNRIDLIRQLLTQSISPTHLEILDESDQHIGHPGAKSGGGHFAIVIAAPQFAGKNLIDCHRVIYESLKDMMSHDIHALRIKIKRD
jgi:BolA family transcriptional regulator, general stress-responsive regulator